MSKLRRFASIEATAEQIALDDKSNYVHTQHGDTATRQHGRGATAEAWSASFLPRTAAAAPALMQSLARPPGNSAWATRVAACKRREAAAWTLRAMGSAAAFALDMLREAMRTRCDELLAGAIASTLERMGGLPLPALPEFL